MKDALTGAWSRTYCGHKFDFENIENNVIDIRDIAHALSLSTRYNGHCKKFYSIAEHSVHVAEFTPTYKFEGLMHDAAEAYTGDIITPFKHYLGNYYYELEARIESVIAKRFGLRWPWPEEVKAVDHKMLVTEFHQLVNTFDIPGEKYHINIRCLGPEKAEKEFLEAFEKYNVPFDGTFNGKGGKV